MTDLTPSTQVAILLTARWAVNGAQPLSNAEFADVKRFLGSGQNGAVELLNGTLDNKSLLRNHDRIQALLHRGFGVFSAVEKWKQSGIWIVSWADDLYPNRFKQLKQRAPVLVFGYGNPNAFSFRALAIVGSRNASPSKLNMAAEIGRACSDSGITVVSGGARGVDSCAMNAGIVGEGTVVGVLADSLLKATANKSYRDAIQDGRMCLMSEVHPEAIFNVGNAMARNRLAYACADAALVIECDPGRGGTWAGALEALREGKSVYVLKGAKAERELTEMGAIRVDEGFALQPERLISSERPTKEIPSTNQTAQAIIDWIGNPVRKTDAIIERFMSQPQVFIESIVQAALSDGYVEPSEDEHETPDVANAPISSKARSKSKNGVTKSLFDENQ